MVEYRRNEILIVDLLSVCFCSQGGAGTNGPVTAGGATSAGGTAATTYTCVQCTGNETDACGRSDGITATVTCDACWAYRDENTTSLVVTYIRGCAQESTHTCTDDNKNEQCETAGGIKRCRRCCTTDRCNDGSLELLGLDSGAADVHASVVVTMASALFAILALWQ
ncbi:uncharacterized protein [Branchiostoma lanceolatum]|uniref:uncharacterized protein n=1 Tax=Branchiostoma lanceolatum TaxID=7740 RepID=UPI003456998C